jgi:hypothetical protein
MLCFGAIINGIVIGYKENRQDIRGIRDLEDIYKGEDQGSQFLEQRWRISIMVSSNRRTRSGRVHQTEQFNIPEVTLRMSL